MIEYGNAIKDLAAADIFTGDMLLKNFGITRNGRVICYDYDELCLLSECRFRRIPLPTTIEEEFAAEPWFFVGEHDVFPEEFRAFLVPPGEVRDAIPRSARRPAGHGVLAAGAAPPGPGRRGGRVPLPPERAAPARLAAGPGARARTGSGARRRHDPPHVRGHGLAVPALGQHEGGVVGLGGVGRVGQRVAAARLDHRFEAVDRRPEIGELVVGLAAEQPDAPLAEHVEVVLARPRLLLGAVRIERRVELAVPSCGRWCLRRRGGAREKSLRELLQAVVRSSRASARMRSTWEKSAGSPQ